MLWLVHRRSRCPIRHFRPTIGSAAGPATTAKPREIACCRVRSATSPFWAATPDTATGPSRRAGAGAGGPEPNSPARGQVWDHWVGAGERLTGAVIRPADHVDDPKERLGPPERLLSTPAACTPFHQVGQRRLLLILPFPLEHHFRNELQILQVIANLLQNCFLFV